MRLNFRTGTVSLSDSGAAQRLAANELADRLSERGIRLTVTEPADPSPATVAASPFAYAVYREGEDICVDAQTSYGYQAAVRAMLNTADALDRLPLCGTAEGDSPSLAYRKKPDGAVRVMIYNHHGQTAGLCGPVDGCEQLQTELMTVYAPDVLALQEYTPWRSAKPGCLGDRLRAIGYTEINGGYAKKFTPLFYRPETLSLLESGFHLYSGHMNAAGEADPNGALKINNGDSKSLTWAVFEVRATGKRFLVIGTHFMYFSSPTDSECPLTPEQATAAQLVDAAELLSLLRGLRARPEYADIPVIAGGDLNSAPGSAPVEALRAGGLTWLAQPGAAEILVENSQCGYPTYDTEKGYYTRFGTRLNHPEETIDHLFTDGDMTVLRAVTVTDQSALCISDHCPKFADFILH